MNLIFSFLLYSRYVERRSSKALLVPVRNKPIHIFPRLPRSHTAFPSFPPLEGDGQGRHVARSLTSAIAVLFASLRAEPGAFCFYLDGNRCCGCQLGVAMQAARLLHTTKEHPGPSQVLLVRFVRSLACSLAPRRCDSLRPSLRFLPACRCRRSWFGERSTRFRTYSTHFAVTPYPRTHAQSRQSTYSCLSTLARNPLAVARSFSWLYNLSSPIDPFCLSRVNWHSRANHSVVRQSRPDRCSKAPISPARPSSSATHACAGPTPASVHTLAGSSPRW